MIVYAEIISQSGTKHLVNPEPYKPVALRVQSLCGFSVDPEVSTPERTDCQFCKKEADRLERQAR